MDVRLVQFIESRACMKDIKEKRLTCALQMIFRSLSLYWLEANNLPEIPTAFRAQESLSWFVLRASTG